MPFDPNAAALPQSGVFGLPHTPEEAKVVLIPVPFEATASYGVGAAGGPKAILEASRQVDLFDLDTQRPYEAGIAMLPISTHIHAVSDDAQKIAQPLMAAGGGIIGDPRLMRVNVCCAQMNAWVYDVTKHWLQQGKIVGLVGGDHSTPFGCIQAHAERFEDLGILHLDAHADLRDSYEGFAWSHASIMFNVIQRIPKVKKLVQVGIRDFSESEFDLIAASQGRIHTFFDARLQRARLDSMPWREAVDSIVDQLPKNIYLSWDIDGLDPTLCPHTGTPVPGGLSFDQAVGLLEGIDRAGKQIVGFDLNEVVPGPVGHTWDANVAARLLYKMIGWTLLTQRKA